MWVVTRDAIPDSRTNTYNIIYKKLTAMTAGPNYGGWFTYGQKKEKDETIFNPEDKTQNSRQKKRATRKLGPFIVMKVFKPPEGNSCCGGTGRKKTTICISWNGYGKAA